MLKGWIGAPEGARQRLVDLGIQVGPYDAQQEGFTDCVVSDEAFAALDPLFGEFLWELHQYYQPQKDETWKHRQYNATVVILGIEGDDVRFQAQREGAVPVKSYIPIFLEHYERVTA